jgi:phosphate transport system protein
MVASTRSVFDRQLSDLESQVLQLFSMVAAQGADAIKALNEHDLTIARRVDVFDKTINRLRYEIEEKSYTLLALQQPNGHDMRRIVGTVSVVTNLERMGDHAAGIARLALRMEHLPSMLCIPEFDQMLAISAKNLGDAQTALVNEDVVLARAVITRDDEIDDLHQKVYDGLIRTMGSDSESIECATMMMWVSHNLERYADRISNICERIIYMATGVLNEPRSDVMP